MTVPNPNPSPENSPQAEPDGNNETALRLASKESGGAATAATDSTSKPYDPLESLLRRGDMLDIDLDDPIDDDLSAGIGSIGPIGANALPGKSGKGKVQVGDDDGMKRGGPDKTTAHVKSSDTIGITTGAVDFREKRQEADLTVRGIPKVSGQSTTMDGGKLARNLSLGSNERYRLRKELGAGGMATVYDAVDLDLRRHVAIKVLHDEHRKKAERGEDSDDRSALQRFVEEAQITGQLEHPNIVPVHEIGRDEAGRIYFTMKRVDGSSLAEILERMRAGDRETLDSYGIFELCEIFVKVCDAIGFAHSRKVIHRDLKPDNIMVGRFGEVQVMDWGLAKLKGSPMGPNGGKSTETFTGLVSTNAGAAQQTLDGTISGTPAYMPPEQARGEIHRIDERSDVFMLGGILYELITLVPPYHAESSLSALLRAQKHDLADPKRAVDELAATMKLPDGTQVTADCITRARRFPPELAAIAMKALSESPADRYQRPQDIARDVERYLKREQVTVYQYPLQQRLMKWVAKNQVKTGIAAAVVVMCLFTAIIVSWLFKMQAEDEAAVKDQLFAIEEQAKRQLESEQARLHKRARASEYLNIGSDLLKRLGDMRDPHVAHESRLEAKRLFTKAIEVDDKFDLAWRARAEVRLDLGHLDNALDDIENAKRCALDEDLKPSPASLMAGAMALLTKGTLNLENTGIMNTRFREYMRLVREYAEPNSDYWELADILDRAMDQIPTLDPNSEPTGMINLGDRMKSLIRPDQRLWEVYLFAAWFAASGWLEAGPDVQARHDFAMSLVNRALELRRNLPLALMFKTQLQFQHTVFKLRASGDPAYQGRGGAGRLSLAASMMSLPDTMAVLDQYVADFPYDPMGHYMRGMLTLRQGVIRSDTQRAARLIDLKRALELADIQVPARNAIALVMEAEGRYHEALSYTTKNFEEIVATGNLVQGNWSPGIGGLCPTIMHVRMLILSGDMDAAKSAMLKVQSLSKEVPQLYTDHFSDALRTWRRVSLDHSDQSFFEAIKPTDMTLQALRVTSFHFLNMGMTREAGKYIEQARQLQASKGGASGSEIEELGSAYSEQLALLQDRSFGSGNPMLSSRNISLSGWRALGSPPREVGFSDVLDNRWLAVLRETDSATVNELREATSYWARRLTTERAEGGMSNADIQTLVTKAFRELERLSPDLARRTLHDCDELKVLLSRPAGEPTER